MCTYSTMAKDWMTPGSPNHIPLPGVWPPKEWTHPFGPILPIPLPDPKIIPEPKVTPDIAQQMLDILKRLDALDKKLGLIDCSVDEKYKKIYTDGLRVIAGQNKCPCKTKADKKKKAKTKKSAIKAARKVKKQLLQENTQINEIGGANAR